MDSKRIEELVNKYWNCETSLEEEQQLREYFRGTNDIPEQWKETASLFRYFAENKKKSVSDVSFDGRVMAAVRVPRKGKMVKLFHNSMRIAAGITVLLAAIWFVHKEVGSSTSQETAVDTYDDPKLAFEETKKALMMISKSFGRAEEETKKINLFNEAREEIQKDEKKEDTKL
jgi:hypothetical protein